MWTGLNQRKFPRTVIACDVFVKGKGDGYALSTMTSNLSRGGLCVMLGRAISKFEFVDIKLLMEDDHDRPIECVGKIVWSIPTKVFRRQTTAFDTGIEFVNLPTADGDRIDHFLNVQLKRNNEDKNDGSSKRK